MPSLTNFTPLLKRTYGDFINPLPSDDTLAALAPLIRQDRRPGENYNFPIMVNFEHGVTHNVDGSAFALDSAIDAVNQNAQLDGATILLHGNLPYDVIAKAMNSNGAYMEAVDFKVMALMSGGEHYREVNLLYGPGTGSTLLTNVGAVNASVSGANLAAPQVVNITRATWSSGLWNKMVNAQVDIYQSDGSTLRESGVTVQAVVSATCRLQLYKAGSTATVASGDLIVLRGSRTKSCVGYQAILQNTGSLFGISAALYPPWAAVSFSAGSAALTSVKIQQFASRLSNNGLSNGGSLLVSSATFAGLVDELDDRDRWTNNSNTSGMKRTGTAAIEVMTPAGLIKVQIHRLMKQGVAMFVPVEKVKRVGATDLTFALPGTNQWFYQELPGNAGAQLRIYSNQAIVIECPYHAGIITNIVNEADVTPA